MAGTEQFLHQSRRFCRLRRRRLRRKTICHCLRRLCRKIISRRLDVLWRRNLKESGNKSKIQRRSRARSNHP
uniref:Uncharacterized protein n=1 Tax=Triticum urartu TaxID=4572 RepID=A0A8R7PUF1_TRIUA